MAHTLRWKLTQILNESTKREPTQERRLRIMTYKSGNGRKRDSARIVWAVVDCTNGKRVSPEYGAVALKTELYAMTKTNLHRRKHGTVEVSSYMRNRVHDEYKRLKRGGKEKVSVPLSQKALKQMQLMTHYFMRKGR